MHYGERFGPIRWPTAALPASWPELPRSAGHDQASIAARVLARLRADILSAHFPPGAKLPLKILRQDYDAGSTPLREALTALCGAGLVIQESQRGFRVAPASRAEFVDIAACRRRIETMALGLSIQHGDENWRRGVVRARDDFARVTARVGENIPIDDAWEERHRRYHFALLAACGSPALLSFCAQLHDRFDRYRRMAIPTKSLMAGVGGDHVDIMDAAIRGEVATASSLLDRHIAEMADLVVRHYDI